MSDFNTAPAKIPLSITLPAASSLLVPGDSLMGIQQLISAGKQADGAAPNSTPAVANGLIKYPASTVGAVGGFFDFGSLEPVIAFLELDFGGSAALTIKVVNLDSTGAVIAGESATVYTGTVSYYYNDTPLRLTSRQALQVTTTGATGAMVFRAKANLERVYRG